MSIDAPQDGPDPRHRTGCDQDPLTNDASQGTPEGDRDETSRGVPQDADNGRHRPTVWILLTGAPALPVLGLAIRSTVSS
jgi:hypothetical protein